MMLRGPVHDLGRDLLATVRGQAVHRDGLGPGRLEERRVDTEALECVASFLGLRLLAHRRPCIGVDDVGAANRLERVGGEVQPAAELRGKRPGPFHDRGVRGVARWMGEADLHPEHRTEQRQRVVDVVAVADEREDDALEPPEPLADREEVGQRLARMLAERQAVDDRDRGLLRELDDDSMWPGPGHDRIDEPLEVAGDVVDALAGAHDRVLGQVDRVPAELVHARLERHAGPEAGLLEEHRERPPDERR